MLTGNFRLIRPSRECREMAVLAEVGRSASVSQRSLARAAGVSATMINAYIDDLLSRGLLEVTGDTNRTYRYFLTPQGRARHEEIFRQLVQEVFELYTRLKNQLRAEDEAGLAGAAQAQSA